MYADLETKEEEKIIYRVASAKYRELEDTGNIDIIKDKGRKIPFEEDKTGARWAEYFEELFNVENVREEIGNRSKWKDQ